MSSVYSSCPVDVTLHTTARAAIIRLSSSTHSWLILWIQKRVCLVQSSQINNNVCVTLTKNLTRPLCLWCRWWQNDMQCRHSCYCLRTSSLCLCLDLPGTNCYKHITPDKLSHIVNIFIFAEKLFVVSKQFVILYFNSFWNVPFLSITLNFKS